MRSRCGSHDTASKRRQWYSAVQWGILNEKDNRDCNNLFGANVFSGYGPGTHR